MLQNREQSGRRGPWQRSPQITESEHSRVPNSFSQVKMDKRMPHSLGWREMSAIQGARHLSAERSRQLSRPKPARLTVFAGSQVPPQRPKVSRKPARCGEGTNARCTAGCQDILPSHLLQSAHTSLRPITEAEELESEVKGHAAFWRPFLLKQRGSIPAIVFSGARDTRQLGRRRVSCDICPSSRW